MTGRFPARWALMLLMTAGITILAGVLVTQLRAEAVASRSVNQELLDLRYLVNDSDRLAWQIIAQGFPNFTFSQQIVADQRGIEADLDALRAHGANRYLGLREVATWMPAFEHDLVVAQRLIAARRVTDAETEVLTGVDGADQLIQQTVAQLGTTFSARAIRANTRLYQGTLIALGATGLLVALLVAAFARGRRRAFAAERAALEHSERRFRTLVQKASEVVLVSDADRRITYVTDSVQGLLGLPPEALIGERVETFLPAEQRPRALQRAKRSLRAAHGDTSKPSEWTVRRADGSTAFIEVQARNLLADPDVAGVVTTVRDVTVRREMEAQLRHQALHDPLTGLANRTLFEDRVAQALQARRRTLRPVAVIYLDVDGFKAVNDSLGHAAGDELLRTLAARIDACLRGVDTAARLGGDEFACLLADIDELEDALQAGRRIISALAQPMLVDGRPLVVQASLGVAHVTDGTIGAEELIRNADLAMYKAKAERRGGIATFHDDLLEAARYRLDLREDLRDALSHGELSLVYQPLVKLAETSSMVSAEALLRWLHPEHGFVGPDRFIPIAEESGLIVALGRWVLDRALADLARWSEQAPELGLNVNVAPRELSEDDYVKAVAAALNAHGIAPHRLTLELTESEFLDDGDTVARLEALTALGVGLAIDDFGTGQSSLARLQRLPVTQVKLDRSFLASIDEQPQNAILVRSTIELGQALGLQMVAEGIERDRQLLHLREAPPSLGPEAPTALGQGYFFARPQDAEAIAGLLAQKPAAAQIAA